MRRAKVYTGFILKEFIFIRGFDRQVSAAFYSISQSFPSTPYTHPFQSAKRVFCSLPAGGGKRDPADGVHSQGHEICQCQDLKLPTVVDGWLNLTWGSIKFSQKRFHVVCVKTFIASPMVQCTMWMPYWKKVNALKVGQNQEIKSR